MIFYVLKDIIILELFLLEDNFSKARIAGLQKLLGTAFPLLRKETIQLKINVVKVWDEV